LWNTAWFSWFSATKYFSQPTFLDAWLSAWTFFAWLKPAGAGTYYIFSKQSNTSYPLEIVLRANWLIEIHYSTTSSSNRFQSTTNIWTWNRVFIIMSWDSSGRNSVKLNINWWTNNWSVIAADWSNSGSISANTEYDFTIWTRPWWVLPYVGSIWECWFCNRVLTDAEKKKIYDDSASQYIVPNILVP
jgi:hypothetical protein